VTPTDSRVEHWDDGPFHPQEPSPLDVLEAIIFNPLRLGLAASFTVAQGLARVERIMRRAWEER